MFSLSFSSVRPPYAAPGLWSELTAPLGTGWTAIVGPNGAGKTTFLRLACGVEAASSGQVVGPVPRLLVPQVPLEAPGTPAGPWEWSAGARWASLLRVGDDWWERWSTLSSGERQRGLLAWCLAQEPAVLALDEPTNHLDETARAILLEALGRYEGVGLVASHDEALLAALTRRVLWLGSTKPWLEQGRWDVLKGEKQRRDQEEDKQRLLRRKERARVEAEGARRRHEAHQAEALKNTKRGLDPKDHDGKARVNGARVSGKDGVLAHQAALWSRRTKDEETVPEGPVKRGMRIKAGQGPRIWSSLRLVPGERVVITGANGCGKSTWLKAQMESDEPTVAYLSQEVSPDEARALIRRLTDAGEEDRDRWLSRVARWGLDPLKVLQTPSPTPGEVQKIRLAALGLVEPAVLALDEPTNHLDREAKALLAETLDDFDGTILLVSHDRAWWGPHGFREIPWGSLPQ